MNAIPELPVGRQAIAATYERTRPYVRRTPIIEIDAGDLGPAAGRLSLKLELLLFRSRVIAAV